MTIWFRAEGNLGGGGLLSCVLLAANMWQVYGIAFIFRNINTVFNVLILIILHTIAGADVDAYFILIDIFTY